MSTIFKHSNNLKFAQKFEFCLSVICWMNLGWILVSGGGGIFEWILS